MSLPTVLFMGGNGHCTARLDRVRAVLDGCDSPPFALSEIAYPGFEGRPRAASFEAFSTRFAIRRPRCTSRLGFTLPASVAYSFWHYAPAASSCRIRS